MHPSRRRTSAKQILDKVKKIVAKEKLKMGDEVWVVIDVDQNSKKDLQNLHAWSEESESYGLALSNPKFEYWLLLHFDEGNNISSIEVLDKRLLKHLPTYNKSNLDLKMIQPRISRAIVNAKRKFHACNDWYRDKHSTVFKLVEKIMTKQDPV